VCIVWATTDVLMCTASIWHMATISVDRYCSIRFPLRYRRTKSPFFVVAKIAFVWIVSIGICSFLALAGLLNPSSVYHDGRCVPAVPQFVIYGSIFAFYVPLLVMFITYALTVRTLSRNVKITASKSKDQIQQHASTMSPEVRTVTTSLSSSEQNPTATPLPGPQNTFAEFRLSTTGLDKTTGSNVEENYSSESQEDRGDDCQTLYVAPSMPETKLMRQTASIGSRQPIGETASTTSNNDDNNKDDDEMRRQQIGSGVSTTFIQSNRHNNNSSRDGDDAHDDDDNNKDYMQMQLRQSCRSDVAASVAVPASLDTERPVTNTKILTGGGTLEVETRHDNYVTHQCHQTVKNTSNEVLSPKAVRFDTSPGETTTQGGGMVHGNLSRPTAAAQKQSKSGRTRRKATRVLGVMFIVFVVMWTPFFVLNLLSAVCPDCVRSVTHTVWTVLNWLGWVSSLANPIIYTAFSPAFREAFKRLLTCRGLHGASLAKLRQQQWANSLLRRRQSPTSNQTRSRPACKNA